MNIDMMTQAYRMLYEIETTLREIVDRKMTAYYGYLWRRKLNEEGRDYYHDTVSYFGKYNPLLSIFTQEERQLLYSLYPVRNKICHMHLFTLSEYDLLIQCHELVTNKKHPLERVLT